MWSRRCPVGNRSQGGPENQHHPLRLRPRQRKRGPTRQDLARLRNVRLHPGNDVTRACQRLRRRREGTSRVYVSDEQRQYSRRQEFCSRWEAVLHAALPRYFTVRTLHKAPTPPTTPPPILFSLTMEASFIIY